MKLLSTLAFAAATLVAATFATAAPAKADNFGAYIGSDGFAIQVSNNHGHYGGYGGRYNNHRDRCRDRWYYKRNRHCWNHGRHGYYHGGYHPPHYYWPKPRRGHWGHDGHRKHGWHDGRGHRGWGHHRGRDDWRHNRGRDDRGRRGHRGGH